MSYNRSSIMSEAWAIVRRFAGNGETLHGLLRRALKQAWYSAKVARQIAAKVAQRAKADTESVAGMATAALAELAVVLDYKDRLTVGEYHQLDLIRRELAARVA